MGSRFTRRRFLTAVSTGAAYLALTNVVGCEPGAPTSKVRPSRTPEAGSLRYPKIRSLPGLSSETTNGVWAFRSRPDLSPPVVEVTTPAYATAPGCVFLAPEKGDAGQGGSLIIDDSGQVVWFRPLRNPDGRAMDFKVQNYRGRPVLTWGRNAG